MHALREDPYLQWCVMLATVTKLAAVQSLCYHKEGTTEGYKETGWLSVLER